MSAFSGRRMALYTVLKIFRVVVTVLSTRESNSVIVKYTNNCPTTEDSAYAPTAFAAAGCARRNAMPSASCPVPAQMASAATVPPALVHAIDSNMDVLASFTRGLRRFVAALTWSWSMAVAKSIPSDRAMRPRPYALSPPPVFDLDLPRLNTTTPRVTMTTCRYCAVGNFLPAATPPIMTGTILQDLPSTCVAKETYRSASFPLAIASICDTPLIRISRTGTSMPARPNAAQPNAPTAVFTALSTSNTRKVWVNFSPLGPYLVTYTSSCSTANAEKAKKIPPTASASFASLFDDLLVVPGPPVAVVAGFDADAPIVFLPRALALVSLSEAMYQHCQVDRLPARCGRDGGGRLGIMPIRL